MYQMSFFGNETALRSHSITKQTRRESNKKINKEAIHILILEQLGYEAMTAREIATVLYKHKKVLEPSRQQVQPRLTELVQDGRIEVCGKRHDSLTGRNVAIYRKVVEEDGV